MKARPTATGPAWLRQDSVAGWEVSSLVEESRCLHSSILVVWVGLGDIHYSLVTGRGGERE